MKLIANGPVKHDGEEIEEGATFNVGPKKQVEALLNAGAAKKPGADDAPAPKGDPDAQTGVTGDPNTPAAAPVPTTPGPAAEEAAKKTAKV